MPGHNEICICQEFCKAPKKELMIPRISVQIALRSKFPLFFAISHKLLENCGPLWSISGECTVFRFWEMCNWSSLPRQGRQGHQTCDCTVCIIYREQKPGCNLNTNGPAVWEQYSILGMTQQSDWQLVSFWNQSIFQFESTSLSFTIVNCILDWSSMNRGLCFQGNYDLWQFQHVKIFLQFSSTPS